MKTTSEILIIGGGIIGLAIAVELKLRGAGVTLISRNFSEAASHAAGGMLAPHAEEIPPGPMLELCLRSRWLYPEWIRKLEELSGLDTGYLPSGILAPVYELSQTQKANRTSGIWLDKNAIQLYQPGLGSDVVGGWWYPEDGQVDNRILVNALQQAAQVLGVELKEGVSVLAIQQQQGRISSILTSEGELQAQVYILTTGSWATQLLPLPVRPVKGQMLAVRMLQDTYQPLPLQRVLFGPQTYLIPRRDGRLIIGATSEDVGWTPQNTPKGIQILLQRAIRLYPSLENWPIEEFWWGFRPGTPDELPILGTSPCDNLILAVGHYRNGILLAPVTASLLSDLILHQKTDPLLTHFSGDRFYSQPSSPPLLMSNSSLPLQIPSSNGSSLLSEVSPTSKERDDLIIAGRKFHSRLMTGTGKYASIELMQQSVVASGCEIVTVAVRRVQTKAPGHEGLADALDWSKIWMLPNTAGCKTAEEAIRVARLGREMAKLLGQEENNFVKLEVIPDAKYLLPDPIGTLEAAEQLVREGFAVLPYINADPLLAKRLEEAGCATVMPLGSPIGSGQGIKNAANISIIIEEAKIPVVVDAGIGTPSEAAYAMELGADALLINSAIALAANPVGMAQAMGLAARAGRLAYLAGRMPIKHYASASSPLTGVIQ
jgi:thiazole synthase